MRLLLNLLSLLFIVVSANAFANPNIYCKYRVYYTLNHEFYVKDLTPIDISTFASSSTSDVDVINEGGNMAYFVEGTINSVKTCAAVSRASLGAENALSLPQGSEIFLAQFKFIASKNPGTTVEYPNHISIKAPGVLPVDSVNTYNRNLPLYSNQPVANIRIFDPSNHVIDVYESTNPDHTHITINNPIAVQTTFPVDGIIYETSFVDWSPTEPYDDWMPGEPYSDWMPGEPSSWMPSEPGNGA